MSRVVSFFSSEGLSMKRALAFLCTIVALFIHVWCNMKGMEPHGTGELLATALALMSVEPIQKAVTSFSGNKDDEQ